VKQTQVKALSRGYEYLMGIVIPVATLALFSFVSEFQMRLLFNQAFRRGLQISRILAGKKLKVKKMMQKQMETSFLVLHNMRKYCLTI
jgi:hypothetical protein